MPQVSIGTLLWLFLSTPSARRATACSVWRQTGFINFYPRPPRGGRRPPAPVSCTARIFLSTPSARRATGSAGVGRSIELISIHALREEGDHSRRHGTGLQAISIHALREEGDLLPSDLPRNGGNFYPRPPRGGRPELPKLSSDWIKISIHALREEGDSKNRDKISIFL